MIRPLLIEEVSHAALISDYPLALWEDDSVLEERVKIFPEGCLCSFEDNGLMEAYAFGHPWHGEMPKLGEIITPDKVRADKDAYFYIHDVVVRSDKRGTGLGSEIVKALLKIAEDMPVKIHAVPSAYGFWTKLHFVHILNHTDDRGNFFLEMHLSKHL